MPDVLVQADRAKVALAVARSPVNWALPLPRRAEDAENLPPSAIKVVREDMHEDVAEGDKGGGPERQR